MRGEKRREGRRSRREKVTRELRVSWEGGWKGSKAWRKELCMEEAWIW